MTKQTKPHIVIVDDEAETVSMLKSFMELFGFEVTGTQSGREGLTAVTKVRPNAVILDLMLPDINGYDVCRMLRRADSTRDLPVIILSAKSAREDVRAGYAAGASRYLKKPVDLDKLIKEVREVVAEGRHNPPPEARQIEDAVRPATGLVRGTVQGGVAVPLQSSNSDVDFSIGSKREDGERPAVKQPFDANDTRRIPGMYIRRERDKSEAPSEGDARPEN